MTTGENLGHLRVDYRQRALSENDVDRDPVRQFQIWFNQALEANVTEPNAMTLATASAAGVPSARVVLLKSFDSSGFAFFTNYDSRKGKQLAENPRAAVVFWWAELERQVRIEGTISKVSEQESEEYFRRRPPGSQIGAAASPQSQPVANREELEARESAVRAKFSASPIPRPANWGGYRLAPNLFEFWQGRTSRLHDRIEYLRQGDHWVIRRLAP